MNKRSEVAAQNCEKDASSLRLTVAESSSFCQNFENFSCDHHIYHPEVETAKRIKRECFEVNGEKFCMNVVTYFYNSQALAKADQSLSYYTCFSPIAYSRLKISLRSEDSSFENALKNLHSTCVDQLAKTGDQ